MTCVWTFSCLNFCCWLFWSALFECFVGWATATSLIAIVIGTFTPCSFLALFMFVRNFRFQLMTWSWDIQIGLVVRFQVIKFKRVSLALLCFLDKSFLTSENCLSKSFNLFASYTSPAYGFYKDCYCFKSMLNKNMTIWTQPPRIHKLWQTQTSGGTQVKQHHFPSTVLGLSLSRILANPRCGVKL